MSRLEQAEVVVVGGGPAGAAAAIRLAGRGRDVLVLERSPAWRWRAGGVFTSPATVRELRQLGVDDTDLAQAIPAMRVETPDGVVFRLTYGADGAGSEPGVWTDRAVGLDRSRLDPWLLSAAEAAGARVRRGATVVAIETSSWRPDRPRVLIRTEGGGKVAGAGTVEARVVVGADGLRSAVARQVGVARRALLGDRIGLTFHLADLPGDPSRDARMVVLGDAYCGIAPVPRGRVNVGIVLIGARWQAELRRSGAADVVASILRRIPTAPDMPEPWRGSSVLDSIEGAVPLATRAARRSGDGWLLVGDAAGFLDPFTGEGLHRALVSARLAADVIDAHLRSPRSVPLASYARAMRGRFASKDLVSIVVQQFLERPRLFAYAARRLERRPHVRATMGLVMGDLVPASRALDPRFLAALLAP